MTSISALSSHHHRSSPLQQLQDELQTEVSSGTIDASDQSALSAALGSIGSALQSTGASDQSGGGTSSTDAFASKINGLIQQQVSAGKLTDEQATELQGIFKAALSHGPHGAGGPPPDGPPPSGEPPSVNGTDDSSSGNSTAELLQQFLQQLKSSLADSTYSATKAGDTTNANDPSLSGVLSTIGSDIGGAPR
ncbi:flagellar hook-basal body complex protein FliE [Bradyrhizobium japonicum]